MVLDIYYHASADLVSSYVSELFMCQASGAYRLSHCLSSVCSSLRVLESQDDQLSYGGVTGRLLWKVLLSDCNGRKVTSPSFYTGSPGYKVKAMFDIHGCVEDNVTYSSLTLKLEKGRFDQQLGNKPLLGKCRVNVLSQEDFSRSNLCASFRCQGHLPKGEAQTVTLGNKWKFAKLSELMQGVYLKDGFLVLEICVEHIVV